MRSFNTLNRTNLIPVEFSPVPEVPLEELDSFLSDFEEAYPPDAVSFGARIVRRGGEVALRKCSESMSRRMGREDRRTWIDGSGVLHRNLGPTNSMHLQHTFGPEIDLIVLITRAAGHRSSTNRRQARASAQLYNDSVLDTGVFPMPSHALRTTAEPCDVVVFDPSQLHAFKVMAESPKSTTAYF